MGRCWREILRFSFIFGIILFLVVLPIASAESVIYDQNFQNKTVQIDIIGKINYTGSETIQHFGINMSSSFQPHCKYVMNDVIPAHWALSNTIVNLTRGFQANKSIQINVNGGTNKVNCDIGASEQGSIIALVEDYVGEIS